MADSLPLILDKSGAVCKDVRPILREVFKEFDFLPPLAPDRRARLPGESGDSGALPEVNQWIEKYDLDRKEIWDRESELKQKHAKRIARERLPNIYKLYPLPKKLDKDPIWKTQQGLIERRDLIPSMAQNSNLKESLWIKNILNRSSCNLSSLVLKGKKISTPIVLDAPNETTSQSISIGALASQITTSMPPPPPPSNLPEYIVCVPPQLNFINFTVGHQHTQALRLVNMSKFEIRLSIRPPNRKELDIELAGNRGLTVTAGAAAEIRVHFRPRDVRVLRDELSVRVSAGKSLCVPIACYMQPPILDILVPAVYPSTFSSSPGCAEAVVRSSDCLELGARLLGDVHVVPVMIFCDADHASFFLLTEDAWLSFNLDALSSLGSLVAAPFCVWPAWWAGGGSVRGCVWCRAASAGLHTAALRVLCSTAVARPLHLLADALYFRPDHLTLLAHEKDYDICYDDDPACEYYVHLGTAFPHRSLSATVQLVNHSPVIYSYYWSVRPWGECSCWDEQAAEWNEVADTDSETLCVGAKEARAKEIRRGASPAPASVAPSYVRVEPARGAVAPRAACALHVRAPDVGAALGLQRAVLMLILKDIPKDSLIPTYYPLIIKTEVVESDPIPGVERYTREVCEVVCAQMEVWWEVAPVRFVLDPCVMHLNYSRRVNTLDVVIRATQLFGAESVRCSWAVPEHVPQPAPVSLAPVHSHANTLRYPLADLPNEYPETDVLTLCASGGEWQSSCAVSRTCPARHPALRPARAWLGVVPPGERMTSHLRVINDTYQHICWWGSPFRWVGENVPRTACSRGACPACRELTCTCTLLRPARGALPHGAAASALYSVVAPLVDGCVATLVRVRRTEPDTAHVAGGECSSARAALVAYRVLAPRLVLRVLPCARAGTDCCASCTVDAGACGGSHGAATLRPSAALWAGRRTCYRLRFTNITPLPTSVKWEPALEKDVLRVMFAPKEFDVGPYAQVEICVVLEARRACGRRLFVHRARVLHAYRPLYLLIDTAISGLAVTFEVPLGGGEKTDSTLVMRRTQKEKFPWNEGKVEPSTPQEMFEEEDRKREKRAERCRCAFEEVYVAPERRQRAPRTAPDDCPPVEIIWEPPALSRVCACRGHARHARHELREAFCLQFEQLPLRTVRTRTVTIRNESVLSAAWSASFRRWPRVRTRTLGEDQWAGDVRAPGVALECSPRGGVLSARGATRVTVAVYADCWGLYRDQLLIAVEHLEPLVLDVWVEAVGAPLHFAIHTAPHPPDPPAAPALCWLSTSDPVRTLRVKNVSRAELLVSAFILTEHERAQDALPLRLYIRFYDVPPATCPCSMDCDSGAGDSARSAGESSAQRREEMDTGVELCLAADYGPQDNSYYKVSPEAARMAAGAWSAWRVALEAPPRGDHAPRSALLLASRAPDAAGAGWRRARPAAQRVRLCVAPRAPRLRVSCCELRVALCALHLPYDEVMRVRKRFQIQNVGNGPLDVSACTEEPWSIVLDHPRAGACGARCGGEGEVERRGEEGAGRGGREVQVPLYLMPRSSMEMCVEVCVSGRAAWPDARGPAPPRYEPRARALTHLRFYDDDNVLKTLPLVLELEYPIVTIEPECVDFGFVTDGDAKKSYFSVVHSSPTESLDLVAEWVGGKEFELWPRTFTLAPGGRERIYIQYTARWCGAPVEGCVRVRAAGGAGAWCRALGAARAAPARDRARRAPHDATDDMHLRPGTH